MNKYAKALRIVNPKKPILEDRSLLAVKIVKDPAYTYPVTQKEIREYIRESAFKKSNKHRYREGNWLENLVEERQTEFDRKEIEKEIKLRRLYEQMTTADMMTSALPAMGDVDLENVTKTATPGTDGSGGSDGSYSFGSYDGTGNAGFSFLLDTTRYDTLKFNATAGGATKIELSINYGSYIALSSGTNLITISSANRGSSTFFVFNAQKSGGSGSSGASISGTAFQRRTPFSVVVSLDSPDASAFIRTGDGGTTEKDKKKKVQDILDGSDAYLENQFGSDFPGTSPREVGQEKPQPGIGKFEPEVIDYETWKNELEKSDDPEVKKILKGDPKKTFAAYKNDTQIAGGHYGTGYSKHIDIMPGWAVSPEQLQKMKANPERFNLTPSQIRMIRKVKVNNKGDTQIAQRMIDTKVKIGGKEYIIQQPEKPGKMMYDKHMGGGVPTIRKVQTNNGDTQIAQITGAPYPGSGDPQRIDWGAGGGKKNAPGPGAKPKPGSPPIKKAGKKNGKKNTKIPFYDVAHYEPQGNPLIEKKKFDAVEPKEHKSGSMRIKSPQQFFNPADVKPEYPKDPPPEMINGWHPKLADGQEIAKRFNKLDPQSAEAMPKTGNPHIDAKVEKAKNNPDKDGPAYRQDVFDKIKKARR